MAITFEKAAFVQVFLLFFIAQWAEARIDADEDGLTLGILDVALEVNRVSVQAREGSEIQVDLFINRTFEVFSIKPPFFII